MDNFIWIIHCILINVYIYIIFYSLITWNAIMNILEKNSNETYKDRYVTQAVNCTASFVKENDLIQIQSPSSLLLSSTKPLSPIQPDYSITDGIDLPNMHPLKHTISIQKENFYNFDNIYRTFNLYIQFEPRSLVIAGWFFQQIIE